MKVNQGLLDWLNAANTNDKDYTEPKENISGLLLAPINIKQQDNHEDLNLIHEINEPVYEPEHEIESTIINDESEKESEKESELELSQTESNTQNITKDNEDDSQDIAVRPSDITEEHEDNHEDNHEDSAQNESPEINTLIGIPDDVKNNSVITEAEAITRELESLKNEVASIAETSTHELDLNRAWHEASAGFELSMNEPPPQIWSSQSESESDDEDNDNDDNNEDYEHIILQQNSSLTLRGTNFTQRLQNILQGRKKKAAELRRKNSEKNKHSHPYIRNTFMFCAVMLLALGLAWAALAYLKTRTPESFNAKASALYEQGKYDEAMNLYQEAYNRYPKVLTFLTGIARSAEKAGHTQTANIAWEEYRKALPDDKKENSKDREPEKKSQTLKININTGGGQKEKESKRESREHEKVNAHTFNEYLNEANRLFNIGMYNRALINFFHALERRSDDIRPYIGIAESYRAKGMYFDAKRILDEARARFGINPTIEAAKEFLKGSK